ncbi:MAG: hypothetical protein AAGK05_19690 [Pseudomonadota bacterium]
MDIFAGILQVVHIYKFELLPPFGSAAEGTFHDLPDSAEGLVEESFVR